MCLLLLLLVIIIIIIIFPNTVEYAISYLTASNLQCLQCSFLPFTLMTICDWEFFVVGQGEKSSAF